MSGSPMTTAAMLESLGDLERAIRRDGFATVRQITSPEDIQFILSEIRVEVSKGDRRRSARTWHDLGDNSKGDAEGRPQILEVNLISRVVPVLMRSQFYQNAYFLSRLLLGPRIEALFDHCIIKPASSPAATEWHQDDAYAGRFSRTGARLHWWLPLQPVDMSNGCMQFVPGSNHGPLLPHRLRSAAAYAKLTDLPPNANVTTCPLAVGDATVHLAKTLHYTGPNNSDAARYAWVVQFGIKHMMPHMVG